jgi:hypothetical protein
MNMVARAALLFISGTKCVELAESRVISLRHFLALSTFQRVGVENSAVSFSFTGENFFFYWRIFRTCLHIACLLHFHPITPSSL